MTSKRLDCLVCGKDDNRLDNAVIIELKQWEKCALSDGDNLVSVWVGGAQRDILHPSAQSIRDLDIQAFNGIVETLRVVLPYVEDIQPEVTSELDRKVYLMMSEEKIGGKLPGWLLSTGTLRILALLSVLRHPKPPTVIIIEEIENGLDPRTIHLLIDEIRNFVESGYGQVIATTHSPYLLDLLKLSQLVVVERDESGSPVFTRPASQKSLADWTQKFSPGKLYTMGKLKRS